MTVKRQALKNVTQASWMFGHPVLRADLNSTASWVKRTESPLNQKGGGWLAELNGGTQTGDDWAAVYIPVNELPITSFEKAQWSYYMTGTETMGVNMVIWMHDPADFDKRAEVTQQANISTLDKAAGWNAHNFDKTVDQMFFYGEGTTGTDLTAGTNYTWEEFQADDLFKNWLIYRISIEYGWEASGTFDPVWVAEVKLNEVPVPLIPPEDEAVITTSGVLTTVSVTKALAAASAYDANDVMSESASNGVGTAWTFSRVARRNGGSGYIVGAHLTSESESVTPRCTLYLFNLTPTSELDDHAANTAPDAADKAKYIGKIDFLALESVGTTDSVASATPSTYGNLPIAFVCDVSADDLFGILVTRDAFTQTAGDDMTIKLMVEQYA